MIEIVFNSNARGAIQVAQTFGRGSWLFKCKPSMMFYGNPDEQAMKELEAQKKAEWEAAEPIDGEAQDVFCFLKTYW